MAAMLAIAGCASTRVSLTPAAPQISSCQGTEQVRALVLWTVDWRADQKDVPLRERAAEQGITGFFAESGCFAKTEVRRVPLSAIAQPEQLRRLVAASDFVPDRVLVITVHELGPVVKLLSSLALVEGGTEVVVSIAAHDLKRSGPPQEVRVHWQNGGPGVIKGVATLPADMKAALAASLKPPAILN